MIYHLFALSFFNLAFALPGWEHVAEGLARELEGAASNSVDRVMPRVSDKSIDRLYRNLNNVYPAYEDILELLKKHGNTGYQLLDYLASDEFNNFSNHMPDAIAIYKAVLAEVETAFGKSKRKPLGFLTMLKERAYKLKFPTEIKSTAEILEYGKYPKETLEYFIESDGFRKYTADPAKLKSVIEEITKANNENWMSSIAMLEERLAHNVQIQ